MRKHIFRDWLHPQLVEIGWIPDSPNQYRRLVDLNALEPHLARLDGLITSCRTSRSVGPRLKQRLEREHELLLAERKALLPTRP